MQCLLAPISATGESSINMMSRDGIWCCCHPIFAVFMGDYPEQVLVTCTYNGQCLKCTIPHDQLGEYRHFPTQDIDEAFHVYQLVNVANAQVFHAACHKAGLKPVYQPFWQLLPLFNIYLSIMPDIFHQMLQGVMKHLIVWLTHPNMFRPAEINACC
jgi:Plavaka transposase